MQFGTKVKNAGTGKGFISYPKDGDNVYRFLEEMEEWTKYYEHFDKDRKIAYPCPGKDNDCPDCKKKAKADELAQAEGKEESDIWGPSKRYLVNVLTDSGYVNVVKLPAGVYDDLSVYSDRFKTIKDREYTVTRFKSEGRVKYAVDRGDADSVDLTQYLSKMHDHQEVLNKAWLEAWGGDVPTEGSATVKSAVVKEDPSPAAPPQEEPKEAPEDRQSTWGDPPPSEPAGAAEPEQADEAEETTEISEDELRKMSPSDLRDLITNCGFEPPEAQDSDILADFLIAKLS